MAKTMTKYQLEHFKDKVRRNFEPLIKEQELLVKQYRTEATKKIVGKLAKKMAPGRRHQKHMVTRLKIKDPLINHHLIDCRVK